MACPICVTSEGVAMTAGMRAGALVLMLAAAIVAVALTRFAWRLWRLRDA